MRRLSRFNPGGIVLAAIILLLVCWLLAGCAGSTKSTRTDTQTPPKALGHTPDTLSSWALRCYNFGLTSLSAEEYPDAYYFLSQVVAEDSSSQEIWDAFLEAAYNLNNPLIFLSEVQSATEWLGPDEDFLVRYIEVAEEAKKLDYLTWGLEELLKLHPDDDELRQRLYFAYAALGRIGEARELLDQLLASTSDTAVFEMQLGMLAADQSHFDEAREHIYRSISLRPVPDAYFTLGNIFEAISLPDSAISAFKRGMALAPEQYRFYRAILQAEMQRVNVRGAIATSMLLNATFPDRPDDMLVLAILLASDTQYGQSDSILTLLRDRTDELGDAYTYYYYRGLVLEQLDNLDEAESSFGEALDVRSEPNAWVSLLRVSDAAGHPDRAFLRLAQTAQSEDDTLLQYLLGSAYGGMRRYASAESLYRAMLAADSTRLEARYRLASILERAHRFEAAESLFSRIVEDQPQFAEAFNYLGYMYAERGIKLDRAKELLDHAIALEPDNGAFLDSYAWVLYRLGRSAEALPYMERALSQSGGDPILLEHMGDIQRSLGKKREALGFYQQAEKLVEEKDGLMLKINALLREVTD